MPYVMTKAGAHLTPRERATFSPALNLHRNPVP